MAGWAADEAGLAAELRDELRGWCRHQGLVGELRGFLRHRLVTLVAGGGGGGGGGEGGSLALLAADLLRHQRLWFSLAVLTAEAGLTRTEPPEARLTAAELKRLLAECGGLADDQLLDQYRASDQPLMSLLLQRAQSAPPPPPPPPPPAEGGNLELRMLQYRRKADAEAQKRYAREMTIFKNDQLRELKRQERERHRRELTAMRRELHEKYEQEIDAEKRNSAAERDAIQAALAQERGQFRQDNDRLYALNQSIKETEVKLQLSRANQYTRGSQTVNAGFCDKASQTDMTANTSTDHCIAKLNVTFDAIDDDQSSLNAAVSVRELHHSSEQGVPPPAVLLVSGASLASDLSATPSGRPALIAGPSRASVGGGDDDVALGRAQEALWISAEQPPLPVTASSRGGNRPAPPPVSSQLAAPSATAAGRRPPPKDLLMSELERRVAELETSLSASRSASQFSSPDGQRPAPVPVARAGSCDCRYPALREENARCRAALERQRLLLESLTERSSELEAQMRALSLLADQSRRGGQAGLSERPLATSAHPSPLPALQTDSVPVAAGQQTEMIASTRRRLGALSAAASRLSRQFRDNQTARQRQELDQALGGVRRQLFGERRHCSQSLPERDGSWTADGDGSAGHRSGTAQPAPLSREERIQTVLRNSRLAAAASPRPGAATSQAAAQEVAAGIPTSLSTAALRGGLRQATDRSSGPERCQRRSAQITRLGGYMAAPEHPPLSLAPAGDTTRWSHSSERSPTAASRLVPTAALMRAGGVDSGSPSGAAAGSLRSAAGPGRSRLLRLLNDEVTAVAAQAPAAEVAVNDATAFQARPDSQLEGTDERNTHPARQRNDDVEGTQADRTKMKLNWENEAVHPSSILRGLDGSQNVTLNLDSQWRSSARSEKREGRASGAVSGHPAAAEQAGTGDSMEHQTALVRRPEPMTGGVEISHLPIANHLRSNPTVDLDSQWKSNRCVDPQQGPDIDLHPQRKSDVDLESKWRPNVDLDSQWRTGGDQRASDTAGSGSSRQVPGPAAAPVEPSVQQQQQQPASRPGGSAAVETRAAVGLSSDRWSPAAAGGETDGHSGPPTDACIPHGQLSRRPSDDTSHLAAGSPAPPTEPPARPGSTSSASSAERSGALLRDSVGYAVDPAGTASGGGELPLPVRGPAEAAVQRSPVGEDGQEVPVEGPPASPVPAERSLSGTISGATGGGSAEEDDFWG